MARGVNNDAYLPLGFDRLGGFAYVTDDEAGGKGAQPPPDQIPAEIRALNGRKVALKGFMLPLTVVGGVTTEYLIMRDRSACCYGAVPKMNQWAEVKMPQGTAPIMDLVVTVYGTLQVGEVREGGYLVAIYSLSAERLQGPDP
jgi:hypothetical protein